MVKVHQPVDVARSHLYEKYIFIYDINIYIYIHTCIHTYTDVCFRSDESMRKIQEKHTFKSLHGLTQGKVWDSTLWGRCETHFFLFMSTHKTHTRLGNNLFV